MSTEENILFWETKTQENHTADSLSFCTYDNFLSDEEITTLHETIPTLNDVSPHKMYDHNVLYLHRKNLFGKTFPDIYEKICSLIWDADPNLWNISERKVPLYVRCIEYHDYDHEGGIDRLDNYEHRDGGSVYTLDILLDDPSEYDGGMLSLLQGENHIDCALQKGDAVIFPSHKVHNVSRVSNGRRRVLIFEFWLSRFGLDR